MKIPLPMVTAPSYGDRTLNEVQRCVNWYPEKTPDGWHLVGAPGLQLDVTTANNQACRGAYLTTTGRTFSVNDNDLYEYTPGTATDRGDIGTTGSGLVRFCDNGTYMLLVDGSTGYVYTLATDAFTNIADVNFPSGANWCCYKDGYFIVTVAGSGIFYLSALNDPADWTPLTFATAESHGDSLVACVPVGNDLLLVGPDTTEPWYNTGNAAFPFERISGAVKTLGTSQPKTIAVDKGVMYMIASGDAVQPSLWAINAGQQQKLSNPYIDSLLFAESPLFGFIYQHQGHTLYQVNLSSRSLVYDITEGVWHERVSSGSVNALMSVLNITDSLEIGFGRANGSIYLVLNSVNSENGTAITRIRTFGPIEAGAKRIFHHGIRFVFEAQHDTTASYTFSANLEWSDDGGLNWSTARTMSKSITSGTTGQRIMLEALRLGSSRQRYYRLTLTGPAARIVLQSAELDMDVGGN